ncbi:ABC transporter ATP-binding protein [Leucobacter sp. NPDC058333]|uniref:ABC transporter ATP-binding protein n=1 Tax=Leucobacter sp. NPDC058333 TaxID=3346450 RepID=UPI003655738E
MSTPIPPDDAPPDEAPLVQCVNLGKSFPGADRAHPTQVLRGVSLAVMPGEMVAIVGPSGSGKSTLLYCLAGLEPATEGAAYLLGTDVARMRRNRLAKLRRDKVGFIFQSYNLIPSLTASENAALPGRLGRMKGASARAHEALEAVGMETRSKFLPGKLSGGQQQRVAIARVLASGASLVFADEPTGALDSQAGDRVLGMLRQIAEGQRGVVLVTHDLEAAARADRVLVLRDGIIHSELSKPTAAQVSEAVRAASEQTMPA